MRRVVDAVAVGVDVHASAHGCGGTAIARIDDHGDEDDEIDQVPAEPRAPAGVRAAPAGATAGVIGPRTAPGVGA